MIITCPSCRTKYRLDDSRIKKAQFKVRCAKCKHVFMARAAANETPRTAAPQPSRRVVRPPVDNSSCVTLTVCNQKGGVAKTSTCLNLGTSLATMGKRVLLVDFDVQANLSVLLGHPAAKSFFDIMDNEEATIREHIVSTRYGVSLLPSNSKMALLSKKQMPLGDFEYLLAEKLAEIKSDYDYILIDTPPSGDFFTLNSLLASDAAIIPTQCEYLSINGVDHIIRMINVINDKRDHNLGYKVLVTMYNSALTPANVILSKIRSKYGEHLLRNMISMDGKVQESQITQQPLISYDRNAIAAGEYLALAQEITGKQFK